MSTAAFVLTLVLGAAGSAEQEPGGTAGFSEAIVLTAAAGGAGDQFGRSVAVDADTVVVGALPPGGAAHVFERPAGGGWEQAVEVATLRPSDPQAHDGFGEVVAICGDVIVVGAELTDSNLNPGAAYVFVRPAGGWSSGTETAKLEPSDPALLDGFGLAVDVSGDTVVVGAPQTIVAPPENRGKVYVYERPASGWVDGTETARLTLAGPNVRMLGHAVALQGGTLVAGAPGTHVNGVSEQGAVFLFEEPAGGWSGVPEALRLTASDGAADALFGTSVDLDAGAIVVGARGTAVGGNPGQGAAYVFAEPPTGWATGTETARLVTSDGEPLGYSCAIRGDTVVAGSQNADVEGNQDQGAAYLFIEPATGWIDAVESARVVASDGAAQDGFGECVALEGDSLVVGARYADIAGQPNQGKSYVFAPAAAGAVGYCTAGTSASGCQALLAASGTPSASAPSGFVLSAAGVECARDGLFFFGTSGRQANPWGNGTSFQCVVPPVSRAGLLAGSGTAGHCDGAFAQDLNALWCASCPKPGKNPGAGALVQAELWYRDPLSTSNQTTSLSNAPELTTTP